MKKLNLFLLVALTAPTLAMAGMPDRISFNFGGVPASGPRMGFDQSPFRPKYVIDFFNDGQPTKADLTLNWTWPAELSFTFYHRGNHKLCTGSATVRGQSYVGNMRCPGGGNYAVTISE